MQPWQIAIIAVASFLALSVIIFFALSYIIYHILLVRPNKKKWARECSAPELEEPAEMFRVGGEWGNANADKKIEVDIVNQGYHLFGEYFDFGYDKAVIILGGRMESCLYGYYFAQPYPKMGFNVLVIDSRAHGLSDGKVSSVGQREWVDVLAWGAMLHDKFGVKSIWCHGICIGSSTALFALSNQACPDYFKGMIAEGMYDAFYTTFKNHMIEQRRPIFPFLQICMLYIRLFSRVDVVNDGPKKRIKQMQKPILFLHSRTDTFSTPDQVERLYADCPAKQKKLVWFEQSFHSRIRINYVEEYDDAIVQFIAECEMVEV